AAADDRLALLHAEALEGVATHGLIAAGAEQERARDSLAGVRPHGARLRAQQEVVAPPQREKVRAGSHRAQEGARGERLPGCAADLDLTVVAVARRDDIVGMAEGAAVAEIDSEARVGRLAQHLLLL